MKAFHGLRMTEKIQKANESTLTLAASIKLICLELLPSRNGTYLKPKESSETGLLKYNAIKRKLKAFPALLKKAQDVCMLNYHSEGLKNVLNSLKTDLIKFEGEWEQQLKTKNWKNYMFVSHLEKEFEKIEAELKAWKRMMKNQLLELKDDASQVSSGSNDRKLGASMEVETIDMETSMVMVNTSEKKGILNRIIRMAASKEAISVPPPVPEKAKSPSSIARVFSFLTTSPKTTITILTGLGLVSFLVYKQSRLN